MQLSNGFNFYTTLLYSYDTIWDDTKILGATSIDKIGEVWLSDEIGGGGVWNSEKTELYNYY